MNDSGQARIEVRPARGGFPRLTGLLLILGLALVVGCGRRSGGGGGGRDDDDSADGDIGDDDAGDDDAGDDDAGDDDAGDDDTGDDDAGDDDAGDDDTAVPADCGWNAAPDGFGGCACDGLYSWCSADPAEADCCASWTGTFTVELLAGRIRHFQDGSGEPWDWDGTVPQGVLDGLAIIEQNSTPSTSWQDMQDLASTYAPEVLSGQVPPDGYVELFLGSAALDTTTTASDTYEASWSTAVTVTVPPPSTLWFDFYDEDLIFDDTIASEGLSLVDLQTLAGRGAWSIPGTGGLYDFTVVVTPW